MNIPVVIAHFNTAPHYLKYALESAAALNEKVVFIGDDTNTKIWKEHWNASRVESSKYRDFLEVYVKMSDYSESYETGFWKRMFLLEEWMKIHRIDKVMLLDSDIISFANYSQDVYPLLPENCYAALVIAQQPGDFVWAASTHCSYWTIEGIADFTNFCIDTYANRNDILQKLQEKYEWHLKNNVPGGVCEMTLLYFWSLNNERVYNFAEATQGVVADHTIKSSTNHYENEYSLKLGVKHLNFKDGMPYGYNQVLQKEVKFFCLHCQGSAKPGMRYLASRSLKRLYALAIYLNVQYIKLKAAIKKHFLNPVLTWRLG